MPTQTINLEDLSSIVQLQQEIITANLDLDQLMVLICQKTQELTQSSGVVVELADGEEMVYRACTGTLKTSLGSRLSIHTSLSGLSVKNSEVLYCEDSDTDSRVDRVACQRVGARSMICVPLIYNSRTVGVLKVASPEPRKFGDREMSILRLLAGLLSASISKAETETLLRESELKARTATQTKSEFLANISHEILTPLNGVLGVASLLEDTTLSDQQKEYVMLIKSSADSLLVLVNDILDFSNIEAKKMVLEKIDFELFSAIEDIRQILSQSAKKKGLELKVTVSDNLPEVVIGDPTRIRQILLNLVGNAIKFTMSGTVEIRLSAKDDNIVFEVIDTGIGIHTDNVSRMFTPFSQVDASTTRKFGGTGLGLSICKELIQLMDGEIGLLSEPGVGSTFWFRVPLPVSEKKIVKQEVKQEHTSDRLKILVAEDNSVNQMIVRVLLEKMGHSVMMAGNGKEAIDALHAAPYDVILMDCQMPEMDGYEASRRIRASKEAWSQIYIIAITANAMSGDRKLCIDAGMNDYISKPMKKDQLLNSLCKVPAPSSSSTSINQEKLNEIREIDDDTLKMLVALYLDSTQKKLEVMATFLASNDVPGLKREAHSLRSSSLVLGAEKMAELAAIIEYAKADCSLDELTKIQQQIIVEFSKVQIELKLFAGN